VLLDSCSSKRMQAEDKHKPLDQSSQPSTNPEALKQYSDSFPLISFKSQHPGWQRISVACSPVQIGNSRWSFSNPFNSSFLIHNLVPRQSPQAIEMKEKPFSTTNKRIRCHNWILESKYMATGSSSLLSASHNP